LPIEETRVLTTKAFGSLQALKGLENGLDRTRALTSTEVSSTSYKPTET
jgi:hypothetical protein